MTIRLEHDVLVITDKSHTAGIMVGGPSKEGAGTAISGGYVQLLHDSIIKATDELDRRAFVKSILKHMDFDGSKEERLERVRHIVDLTPGLLADNRAIKVRDLEKEEVEEGFIEVAGTKVWVPGGVLVSRRMGDSWFRWIEDINDLRGKIELDRDIKIAGIGDLGPVLGASSSGCGACGACGVCGGCIICAEINYAVATAAATAAVAVTSASAMTLTPDLIRADFSMDEFAAENRRQISDVKEVIGQIERVSKTVQ